MRNYILLLLFFYLFTFYGCKNTIKSIDNQSVDSILKVNIPNKLNVDSIFKSKYKRGTEDTFNYPSLQDLKNGMLKDGDAVVSNLFEVDGNEFRIIKPVKKYNGGWSFFLEMKKKHKWINEFDINHSMYSNDIITSKDINNDGFNDILNETRFNQEVYFYNPTLKTFIDTSSIINPDWQLLDNQKKLFCDIEEYKGMCGQVHSTLFTFKNYKKNNFFDLELYNCDNEVNHDSATKFILRKNFNGSQDSLQLVKETKLKKPINIFDFNYKKYWQENYKHLIK